MKTQFPPIIINILSPLLHLSLENLIFKKEFVILIPVFKEKTKQNIHCIKKKTEDLKDPLQNVISSNWYVEELVGDFSLFSFYSIVFSKFSIGLKYVFLMRKHM